MAFFLFTRCEIRYAFAKLTSFLLGALKVFLGDVVSRELFLAAFLSVMRQRGVLVHDSVHI